MIEIGTFSCRRHFVVEIASCLSLYNGHLTYSHLIAAFVDFSGLDIHGGICVVAYWLMHLCIATNDLKWLKLLVLKTALLRSLLGTVTDCSFRLQVATFVRSIFHVQVGMHGHLLGPNCDQSPTRSFAVVQAHKCPFCITIDWACRSSTVQQLS